MDEEEENLAKSKQLSQMAPSLEKAAAAGESTQQQPVPNLAAAPGADSAGPTAADAGAAGGNKEENQKPGEVDNGV